MANNPDKIILPYTDVPHVELPDPTDAPEGMYRGVKELQIGFGARVMRADQQGLWLGADRFEDAPFSVDMDGNIHAATLDLSNFLEKGNAASDINTHSTTISGGKITTGSIVASKLDVDELSAISADLGSITAGTITGALIRTSSTGGRVVISGTDDNIVIYDSGNEKRVEIYQDMVQFNKETGLQAGTIFATDTGTYEYLYFDIQGNTDGSILFDIDNTGVWGLAVDTNLKFYFDHTLDSFIIDEDLQPDGSSVVDIGTLTNPFDDIYCDLLTETSDIRVKEDVQPLSYGLKEILKLEPITYRMSRPRDGGGFRDSEGIKEAVARHNALKRGGMSARSLKAHDAKKQKYAERTAARRAALLKEREERVHIGFSAQAVYKVMPEVTRNAASMKSKGLAGLSKTQMIPVLVKALQELATEVETLKKGGGKLTPSK